MAEQRWWIRSHQEPGRAPDWRTTWHLEMHKDEGPACGRSLVPPIERVTEHPGGDAICAECLRIEPFARGMSHAVGSGDRLPEPP
jgi:hypothetical protein